MLRIASIAAIWLVFVLDQAAAGDMQAPRIARAEVDWQSAAAALGAIVPLQALHASADAPAPSSDISRLNAATAAVLPGIARSTVPVLLPFDLESYLRDRAAGAANADPDQAYFFGFGRAPFFDPGPAGYDAAFRIQPSRIPDLADIRFGEAATITISGSLLTYELDPPVADTGAPVPALEADFPGIRRIMLENYVRYTFVRFGVPYVVSIDCFDGSFARFRHMACRDADRVIERFLKSLRVAGGMPQAAPLPVTAPAIARPAATSPTFTYASPGRLVAGTGLRGNDGRRDYTVYADIGFPLAEAPAFANTQYYKNRVPGGVMSYPWRDDFCERRSYYVGQCPGGMGHQGQDIRAADCNPKSTGTDGCTPHQNDIVAVRDGMILRAPNQEAVYLVVNTPTEHIRFRYLHMRPKLLDADGVVSGRKVTAGEVLGQIGNFSQYEHGTSYHLHFDVQVPTRSGWVFVNPYMTLVAAYERLIGGRGEEMIDDVMANAATTMNDAASARVITLAAIRQAILAPAASETPFVEQHAPPRFAAAPCGVRSWRYRSWQGCGAGQFVMHGRTFRGMHGGMHYGHYGMRGATYGVRHGYSARATVQSRRFHRRYRS
jgi:peptidase M23-like protein